MSLLRKLSNRSESIRRTTSRRALLFSLLTLMLVAVVATGSFLSVVSARRAARQSSSVSTTQENSSNAPATSDAKQGPQQDAAALQNLSPSANHHWAALSRFAPQSSPSAAVITATKADALFTDVDGDTKADPGDTLQYTIVVSNTGNADATNTLFTDTLTDTNLQFVAGSVETTPIARNDSYTGLVGNVSYSKNAAGGVLANDSDPDNVGPALTVTAGTFATTQGGSIVLNSDRAVVSFTTSGMVWFINNNAGACTSSCDGRLSHPFTSLANFQAVNDGVDNVGAHSFHPADHDNIFISESSTGYVGPVTLRSGQKLIGQDATASLETITGLMPPADSPSFPTMNSGNATITKITSAGNGINVSTGNNTIRGLTVGTTTGVGISSGASFGTLTISDTNMADSPNRGGQALGLTSGTLAATFANIRSTNSSAAGVSLTSVSGSLTSSGVTSITNPGTIGISVGTSS